MEPTRRVERRHAKRFPVALPVTFEGSAGVTRDVSATGVHCAFRGQPSRPLQPGMHIRLQLLLEHVDPHGPLEVLCEGKVVRIEHVEEQFALAVTIDSYQFAIPRRSDGN